MTRENNIYGKLVNNKFSDLLTADMNATWQQMHAVLDREMPQDKEKRRAVWIRLRSTGTVIAIALLASAITWYSYHKNAAVSTNNNIQDDNTVKEIKQVPAQEFLTSKTTPLAATLSTAAILSKVNAVNKNSIPSRESFSLNTQAINNIIETKKYSNNYVDEGFNSQGMIFGKRYSLSAIPVIEHFSTEKLLSKGDLIIPGHLSLVLLENKKLSLFQKKTGWVLGAAIHYNAPMSNQEISLLNINGKKNSLIDFIPSLFAQYHLNNKWYVETGFQYSSPQYTADLKLFSSCVYVAVGKRKERAVWLNKLYYMNIPLSIHFKLFNGISIGTGVQYSHLKRSLLLDEHAGWKEAANGEWNKTYSSSTVNSTTRKPNGNTNSDYPSTGTSSWGTPSATATPATNGIEMASEQFKSSDWRYLLDLNYTWKKYSIGTRYTAGINNYINTQADGNMLAVKDKNKAIQVYVRMKVLDLRK